MPPSVWLLELPLLLGILAGWTALVFRGRAFVLMAFPAGHDWFEYLADAWMAWHRVDAGFHAYRSALYPYLLGGLGERIGYAQAGLILSSISMCVLVVAAGLGARALAGPWAGAVAAASVPWLGPYAESARWVNLYPALAASCGLALALGACSSRWPRPVLALASGLASGLAAGLDARGLTAAALVGLLVAAGSFALPSRRARVVVVLLFVVGTVPGPLAARAVALRPALSAAEHSVILRRDTLPMIRNRAELAAACPEAKAEPLSIDALRRPCARALLAYNGAMLDRFLPYGLWGGLVLLGLAALPGRRGWRASLASIAVLGWPVPLLLLPSLWVVLPERYLFPVAAPLLMLPPVAATRALRSLLTAGRAPIAAGIACLVTALAWAQHACVVPPVEPLETHVLWAARGRMMTRIQDLVRPGDTLLDCSGQALEAGLLPRRFHAGVPSLSGVDLDRCERWIDGPERRTGTHERGIDGPERGTGTHERGIDGPERGAGPPGRGNGAVWIVTGVRCEAEGGGGGTAYSRDTASCRPAIAPREMRRCAHGLEPWRCSICAFEARARGQWELVYTSVKEPDRESSLQLWRRS